ncbi:MAG TPA: type II toxin-antitoxin system death-on-curing family toxin [Candidatus Thermoplasmatota archaeon]|nr:type II toxin-antitoxin system death-on-curing family toxin [Candidatus Thermoplasmatota archaeon]
MYRYFCHILGKKIKYFKKIDDRLVALEKPIRLYVYLAEYLYKNDFRFNVVNNINYPTVETIKNLHDFLVIKYQKDIDKIHTGQYSLAPLQFTGIKYFLESKKDKREDIIFRGAHIFNKFLEEGHPFIDGNKRTGWVTLWLFLAANGYIFIFPIHEEGSEQARKVEKWASYKENSENIKEIMDWIRRYIKKRKN